MFHMICWMPPILISYQAWSPLWYPTTQTFHNLPQYDRASNSRPGQPLLFAICCLWDSHGEDVCSGLLAWFYFICLVSCASKDPIAMVCIVKSEHQVSLLQYGYDLHNDFDAYLIDYYWSGYVCGWIIGQNQQKSSLFRLSVELQYNSNGYITWLTAAVCVWYWSVVLPS